jgi:hypothetical protein
MSDSSVFGGILAGFDEVRALAERAALMEKARGLRRDVEALKKKGQIEAARKRYGEYLQVQKRLGEISAGPSAAVKGGQSVGGGVGKLAAGLRGADYGLTRAAQTDVGGHPSITPLEQKYLQDRMTSSSAAADAARGATIGYVTPRHPSDTTYDLPQRSTNLPPAPDRPTKAAGSAGLAPKGGTRLGNTINSLPLTEGQRNLAKIGSGDLGLMAEGYWGMVKGAGQHQANEAQTVANHVAKPVAEYIRMKLPNGLLRPDLEMEMRKLGMNGKVWAETIKAMDPTQFPAFVEMVTQEADANGQTGVAKMGHDLMDMMRRIGEGDEDAGAQLLGMWNAFAFSVATAKTVGGGLKPTTNPFAKFSKFAKEYVRPKNVSGPTDWQAVRAREARIASKSDGALLGESIQRPLKLGDWRGESGLQQNATNYVAKHSPQLPIFTNRVQRLARTLGGKTLIGNVKSIERTGEKVFLDEKLKLEEVGDVIRATVVVDDYPEWTATVKEMKRRFKVVSAKNRVAKPKPNGYQDYVFVVKLEDGALAEVQVNVPEILEAKEATHHLYRQVRSGKGDSDEIFRQEQAAFKAGRDAMNQRLKRQKQRGK